MGQGDLAGCAIRVSGGWATTEDDWDRFVEAWLAAHARHAARQPRAAVRSLTMAAVKQTVEHVESLEKLQARLRHRHRPGLRAQGPERRHRPLHLGQEERAGVDAGTGGWTPSSAGWRMEEPDWAKVQLPADRLPGQLLLRRAQGEGRAEEPRRGRSGAPGDLREARHPAARTGGAGRRRRARRATPWTRCSTASRWSPPSRRSWPRSA